MSLTFWAAYAVACLAAILAAEAESRRLALALKLVPVGLLLAVLARHLPEGGTLTSFVFAGLLFSLVGDAAIAFSFVSGLAAFLCAHFLYIGALGWSDLAPARQALAFAPAALLWLGMLLLLARRVPRKLLIPVVVYLTVISVMFGRATGRAFVTDPSPTARLFFGGALLFVVSDALIAFDKWVPPVRHAQAWILLTYYSAQALIASSAV